MRHNTCFVSYSSHDSIQIEAITKMLKISGNEIFRDRDSILPGEKWKMQIDKAIKNSNQIIVFWCCHSSGSEWVNYEINSAVELKKPIIPILCCDYKLSANLKEFQWIDLRGIILHLCNEEHITPHCLDNGNFNSSRYFFKDELIDYRHNRNNPRYLYWLRIRKSLIIYSLISIVLYLLLILKPCAPLYGNFAAHITNLIIIVTSTLFLVKALLKSIRLIRKPNFLTNDADTIYHHAEFSTTIINKAIKITKKYPFEFYPRFTK